MIITLGFYAIYWYYQTSVKMAGIAPGYRSEPGMWTILLLIPFAALYSFYQHAELYEAISRDRFKRWFLWVLLIFFSPAVWAIVQVELNRRANYGHRTI